VLSRGAWHNVGDVSDLINVNGTSGNLIQGE
jgi:hypothetical protein